MKCSNCRCIIPDSSVSCMYCGQPVPKGDERTEPVSFIGRRASRKRNAVARAYTAPVYTEPSYCEPVYYEQPHGAPVNQESAYRVPICNEPLYSEWYYGSAVYRDPSHNEPYHHEQPYRAPSHTEQVWGTYQSSDCIDSIHYAYNDGCYDDRYGYGGYNTQANYDDRCSNDNSGRRMSAFDFSVIREDGSLDVAKCLLYFLALDIAALLILFILGLALI